MADGASTADVAAKLGPGLTRSAIAGRINLDGQGRVVDLNRPLPGDCELSILTSSDDSPDSLHVLRHSTAHVMAEAICKLFPETQLVYGPSLDDGFYYDIDLPRSITPDDFSRIEDEMAKIIKEKRPFTRYETSREQGLEKLRNEGSRYKIENAERAEGNILSFYVTGENRDGAFEDLCQGPHLPSTGVIKAFSIRQVSRSFYHGDVNDKPLQRVYGTAFFKKSSLVEHLKRLEEAKKRDHRVVGRKLELFSLREQVGTGLVLWLHKGVIIRTELENHLTNEMLKLGYQMVRTPHIGQLDLFRTSGHFPYYEESQYPAMFETARGKALQSLIQAARQIMTDGAPQRDKRLALIRDMVRKAQELWGPIEGFSPDDPVEQVVEVLYAALACEPGYLLKPMNCPHHIQIYLSKQHSYRDLPVRLGEYGTVHRYEQSGEVAGLVRARGFTQDDAHLFCTPDQLPEELLTTVRLTQGVLEVLGMTDYRIRLGLRDPASDKYVGSQENWNKAEAAIRQAVKESSVDYTEEVGDAAFYGPKIDFVVKDCIGREWQLGTVQVDYNLPERFDLSYVGADNASHRPIMIHRTPFGSMERFVAILIEHFAGAFPLWLAPVQVGIASISEKSTDYARSVLETINQAGLRAELDLSSEKIGPKKHRFREALVNYILVVGEQEAVQNTVNVNDRGGKTIGDVSLDRFIADCRNEVDTKSLSSMVGK